MSFNTEKRLMDDRRQREEGPPKPCPERRGAVDRRQVVIKGISFFEWASHFARFQGAITSEAKKDLSLLSDRGCYGAE